jgi:hypothetical protein
VEGSLEPPLHRKVEENGIRKKERKKERNKERKTCNQFKIYTTFGLTLWTYAILNYAISDIIKF